MAISDANKLAIYNGALLFIGERKLVGLTDSNEPRRLLDGIYDRGGINTALEKGQWNFAMRSAKLEYAPSITPAFGYERAFEKPSDFVRLCALCADEFFTVPLLQYSDEAGLWFASEDEIYIKYVSDDSSYGKDFSLWPESFIRFVESYFGSQISFKLTQNRDKSDDLKLDSKKLLMEASSIDAMNDPTAFRPPGRWRNSRGRGLRNRDNGHRSRLLG
jgi:hypothetical protein